MKKATTIYPFLLFISGIFFLSCKKESSTEPECSLSMQKMAGTYKITKMEYKRTSTSLPEDALATTTPCEKDDLLTLNANGTFSHKDAGLTCLPVGDSNGNWSLTGKTFKMDGSEDASVESFDCRALVVYIVDEIIPGDKLTITLTRQ